MRNYRIFRACFRENESVTLRFVKNLDQKIIVKIPSNFTACSALRAINGPLENCPRLPIEVPPTEFRFLTLKV